MSLRDQIRSEFRVAREMGDEMLVPCPHPEHDDENPSASINVKKRLWCCYACGRGGTLEQLLGERIADENIEDMLAEITGELIDDHTRETYPEAWLDQFDAAGVHPYWIRRGLSEAVCRKFRLGYDFDTGRATYPLRSPSGAVLGVVGRLVDDEPRPDGSHRPKYKYPPGANISQTLFAYYLVRNGARDVVLAEGALDAIAMWDVGIPALAQMGARLSRAQIDLLRALGLRTLTFAYDQDHAGREAMERAITNPLLNFCALRIMSWSPQAAKDPMDLPPEQRRQRYEDAEMIWGGW